MCRLLLGYIRWSCRTSEAKAAAGATRRDPTCPPWELRQEEVIARRRCGHVAALSAGDVRCEGKMLKGLGCYFRSAFQASFGFGSRVSGLWVSWEPRPPEHGLAGAERGCVASSGSPAGARRDASDCASAGGWWVHVPSLQLGTRPLSPSHLECSPWPCPGQGWWEPICGKHLLGKEGQTALHLPPLLLAGMEMKRCSFILELGWEVKRKGV